MAVTPITLLSGIYLSDAVAVIYSATGNVQITNATLCNTDTSPHTVTVYIVRASAGPGISNVLISARTLAPGQTYVSPEMRGRNMAAGDTIQAFASVAAKVNAVIDGFTF